MDTHGLSAGGGGGGSLLGRRSLLTVPGSYTAQIPFLSGTHVTELSTSLFPIQFHTREGGGGLAGSLLRTSGMGYFPWRCS